MFGSLFVFLLARVLGGEVGCNMHHTTMLLLFTLSYFLYLGDIFSSAWCHWILCVAIGDNSSSGISPTIYALVSFLCEGMPCAAVFLNLFKVVIQTSYGLIFFAEISVMCIFIRETTKCMLAPILTDSGMSC